jgi:hypothetical protein
MRELRSNRWALIGLGLVLLGSGCQRDDTDRLARVGRKLADKADVLSAQANNKVVASFHTLRAHLDEVGLDARVSARLGWDKTLAGINIQVQATDGRIQLTGKVPDLSVRRRAVELAESTLGVTEVIDSLEVAAPEP